MPQAIKNLCRWGAAGVTLLLPLAGFAANERVTGGFAAAGTGGGYVSATFTCFGLPTCTGLYAGEAQDSDCSNTFALNDAFTITGIDVSRPGTFAGTLTIPRDWSSNVLPGGTCTYRLVNRSLNIPYTGTWDGSSGTISYTGADPGGGAGTVVLVGAFYADVSAAPAVFPIEITGSITPTVANISATFQPRPQDVGTTASVFVFAHAPSTLVRGAVPAKRVGVAPSVPSTPADAVVCVLAQVGADGQLTAASASTLQAYTTNVLSAQGQSVNVLNNVSTPNVAGASVYVGYGPSAASMLSNGVYQSAVSVPGAVQCTASVASAPAAKSPAALSGLWWNASESGWGIHFTQRGVNLFAAWYTYDAQGNPKWYVAPSCTFSSSNAVNGNCTSALYEVSGVAFFGHDFDPTLYHPSQVGTLQLTFQNTNAASMTYVIGSQARTVAIVRQIFPVAATSPPAVDYTDLWWNPNESGWGMAIAQQFGNIFLAWYVYDATGKPFWYVAPSCTVSGSSCSGTLYRTTAPAFGPPLDPTQVHAVAVGSATVKFSDANNAVLSSTVDGITATKTLTRQIF